MPKLGIVNMILGFAVIAFAAATGALLATDITDAFLNHPERLQTWQLTLQRSAHGHANLFGILHVLFGLTLPWSKLSNRIKTMQTIGLFLGVLAVGPLMYFRSFSAPVLPPDAIGLVTGGFLVMALLAVSSHSFGLALKAWRP